MSQGTVVQKNLFHLESCLLISIDWSVMKVFSVWSTLNLCTAKKQACMNMCFSETKTKVTGLILRSGWYGCLSKNGRQWDICFPSTPETGMICSFVPCYFLFIEREMDDTCLHRLFLRIPWSLNELLIALWIFVQHVLHPIITSD